MEHPKFTTTLEVSKQMSNIHLKSAKAEAILAKALWHKGYRYHRSYKSFPVLLNITTVKYRIAIFVDR